MPFVISLLQESSRQFPGTSRCKFLVEGQATAEHPLGVSQCGIYNERPSACRVYPTKFDKAGELAVLCEAPAPISGSSHPAHRLCARPWEQQDFDPIEQVQHLAVAKFEMNFFFKLAEAWNARPRDWQVFPEFLQMVYSNRIRAEADCHEGECDETDQEVEARPIVRFPRLAA
ncbi:MAG TPA: YkgJ family cysteine cluster protein [Planctomycetaceae bacterium]|nr:YkgJ family cysteine cluster protein [Planctomycetaceae bacterium]